MRHVLSILLQNESGALSRVAAMFANRGFNIESLSVAPTEDETVSRLTLVTSGDEDVVAQVSKQLLHDCDICAVPSLPSGYSSLQLPSKLIDAMVAGRAVVASDFPPIRWALGETSTLVAAGDSHALAEACRQLKDPHRRAQVGKALRGRAVENFTPQAVAPRFAEIARAVVGGSSGPTRKFPSPDEP